MKISLSNFKSKIDPVIVERGEGYFYQRIVQGEEEGAEDYNVKIKIENDELTESARDCVL